MTDKEDSPAPYCDAHWKNIQQNTFTRWINSHLIKTGESVDSLVSDFSDGLKLIKLVEVLSRKSVGKFNRKVAFRSQKLENVSVALKFLQEREGIKLVTIDSSHIVDQNSKLILGLVWTLILHYSISRAMTAPENVESQEEPGALFVPSENSSPKNRLLTWIRSKMPPDVPLTNFTSDWNDGVALGALVASMIEGCDYTLTDWRNWSPDAALQNTKSAMMVASEVLDVSQLITAEELINPNIDERSVMTYLAQFPQAKKPNPKGRIENLPESAVYVGESVEFVVNSPSDRLIPRLFIVDEEGKEVSFTLSKVSALTHVVRFRPPKSAEYKVKLYLKCESNGEEREKPDAEATLVARRPPTCLLRETAMMNTSFPIKIENENFWREIDATVVSPSGEEEILQLSSISCDLMATFLPKEIGGHTINITQEKKNIPGSPLKFTVHPELDESVRVWGRGLASTGVLVGERVAVHVDREDGSAVQGISPNDLSVTVKHVSGLALPVHRCGLGMERLTWEYIPMKEGEYRVEVQVLGKDIGSSSYKVYVAPACHSLVRAFGAGLEGGVALHPSVFYVESNEEEGRLEFAVEGPSKTEIRCEDRKNGSAIVEYTPPKAGIYSVSIFSGREHILGSPFVVSVEEAVSDLRPSAVTVEGLHERTVYTLGRPVSFNIDTTHACDADLIPSVSVLNAELQRVESSVSRLDRSKKSFTGSFVPSSPGKHWVNVCVKGVGVAGSPFPVHVQEAIQVSRLRIFGPGVDGPVLSKQPTHFTIDAKQAGRGTLDVALSDGQGQAVDIDVLDNEDGSFTVKYVAPKPGAYQLNVIFAGEEIPKIEINVKPNIDLSGIRVEGLENAIITINCEKEVHVFTSNGEKTRVVIRSPSGRVLEAIIEPSNQGLRVRFTPSEIGDYTIDVTYEDVVEETAGDKNANTASYLLHAVPKAPLEADRAESEYEAAPSFSGPRADMVCVSGAGLGPVVASRSTQLHIDASLAGMGDIDVYVDGPTRTPIHCVDNHDGTCSMYYVPRIAGIYWLRVMFDGKHVTGSPFQVMVVPPLLATPSLHSECERSDFTASLSSGSSTPLGEVLSQ